MAWPAIIAGGASLIGGLLSNRAQRQEASRNRRFQKMMSDTSWQRGVEDMKAAGLNPALAYSRGGASSPGGSMAQQSDVVSPAVSSAMAAKRLTQELKNMRETERQIYNQAQKLRQESLESAARRELVKFQSDAQELNNRLLNLQLPWARATARAAERYPDAAILNLLRQAGGGGLIGSTLSLGMAGRTELGRRYAEWRKR